MNNNEKPVIIFEVHSKRKDYDSEALLNHIIKNFTFRKLQGGRQYHLHFSLPYDSYDFKYADVATGCFLQANEDEFECGIYNKKDYFTIFMTNRSEDEEIPDVKRIWIEIHIWLPGIEEIGCEISQLKWEYSIRFFDRMEKGKYLKPLEDFIVKGATETEIIEYDPEEFE